MKTSTTYNNCILIFCLLTLQACGGAGNYNNQNNQNNQNSSLSSPDEFAWSEGIYPASSLLEGLCETPRSGNNFIDVQGSAHLEKMWLRSWSNETYLWYDEIIDTNPNIFSVTDYFDLLITNELTSSGAAKDNFHFYVDTETWNASFESGESSGYGARFTIDNTADPRTVIVVYSDPDTPATSVDVNMQRGTRILSIDGVDINANEASELAILNAGLSPASIGETHTMTIQNLDDEQPREITITSATVTSSPVQHVTTLNTESGNVGYLLFNSHISTAEEGLVNAINTLADNNITDLVLDLRYNGGGALAIASQLAYMITGPITTSNKVFERTSFNDKHPIINPVTGETLTPVPFYDQTLGFSLSSGQSLPYLELSRVFILSTEDTCSASESIINGLQGVGIDVIQIGNTTCGKPYGFYATDNCSNTYFTVQFQGVNDVGFGDYSDGFTPENSDDIFGVPVPGCTVNDDLDHGFGDPNEALLSAALHYRNTGICPELEIAETDTISVNQLKTTAPRPSLNSISEPIWTTVRVLN